MNSVIDNDSR